MSQSEYIQQAVTGATVKPIVKVLCVNDELLAAVDRLTGEYRKIGGNLNQIAHYLNEYGASYNPCPRRFGPICLHVLYKGSPQMNAKAVSEMKYVPAA